MGRITGGLDAEAYDRSYSDRELLRRVAVYFRPHAGTMVLVAGMVALASLVATVIPFTISRGIEGLTGSIGTQVILGLAALITVLGALGWVFNLIRQVFAARAVGDVVLALREDAFRAVMRRDMSFYDQFASGRIVSRVTSDTQDFATTVTLTMDLLSQLVLVGVIITVMLVVNWQLALITLTVVPVVTLVAFVFRRLARRAQQRAQRAQATVNATIGETISGIAVAKNFRQESALFTDFQATNALAYRVQLLRVAVFSSIFPLLNTLSGMGVAVVVYFGGLQVLRGGVNVGEWFLFVQSLAIFFYPLTSISSFWSQFQRGLAASERVFALIDAQPRVTQTAHLPVEQVRGEIVFDHVSFSYADQRPMPNDHQAMSDGVGKVEADAMPQTDSAFSGDRSSFVLNDFSLTIPAGQTLAIVGHTGAGKSSLVKLIMRFYEFQAGQLLVDGRDIRTLDLGEYRRHVGYVPQAPFLFNGTVADNIRYGRRAATLAEVERAARQLGDGTWVDDLPNGLETDVGERGGRLSLGQRQLVALARVLFHNPAIVLLDEATASIDPVTETQVQAGLDVVLSGRTSIVIAHRLSTVRAADRIIVLRAGQVIEAGTHEHLLTRGGHYAELYNAYFRHQTSDYQV